MIIACRVCLQQDTYQFFELGLPNLMGYWCTPCIAKKAQLVDFRQVKVEFK